MNTDLSTVPALPVLIHLAAALLALTLGTWQMLAPRGSLRHRGMGYLWVTAMGVTAISSFWIKGHLGWSWLTGFSWIHLLSVWILVSLAMAVMRARQRQISAHRGWMRGAFGGLVGAGVFAALDPGRVLGHWLLTTVPASLSMLAH